MAFSDILLMIRARQGDRAAFGMLYDRHAARVYTLLYRLCASDRQAAEDLTQEAFIAAYSSLHSWRGVGALSSWLCGIAVNQWRGYNRARAQSLDYDSEDPPEITDPLPSFSRDSPFERLAEAEALAALDSAIAALPESCRAAFVLVYVEQFSYNEAAALLEVPTGTIQSRLNRAKRLLQASIASTSPWLITAVSLPNSPQKGDPHAI